MACLIIVPDNSHLQARDGAPRTSSYRVRGYFLLYSTLLDPSVTSDPADLSFSEVLSSVLTSLCCAWS